MNHRVVTAGFLILSVVFGASLFFSVETGLFESLSNNEKLENHSHTHGNQENSSELRLGSAHEHALFYVNVNNTEVNFSKQKYQLRSKYVHMENFKPHIVHKHSKNVTWRFFLETMDIKVENTDNQSCITISDNQTCGEISVILKGEEISSLEKEIEQGDNLAIITPPNRTKRNKYMNKTLPKGYKPDKGFKI